MSDEFYFLFHLHINVLAYFFLMFCYLFYNKVDCYCLFFMLWELIKNDILATNMIQTSYVCNQRDHFLYVNNWINVIFFQMLL